MEQKFSYGDIQNYKDICFQSASRMWFLGAKKWCSANVFFWQQTETCLLENWQSQKGDLFLENLKIKKNSDDVHWNVWTNIKMLCDWNNIFKKKKFQIGYFESFTFWSKFRFWGQLKGFFARFFLINFSSSANNGGRQIYSPPPPPPRPPPITIKKLPTALFNSWESKITCKCLYQQSV